MIPERVREDTVSGYQAQIEALRSAAEAARSAGEQVSGVDLAGSLGQAGAGMPGARSVQSVETLGNAWNGDIESWTSQADGYAAALDAAAETYSANEDAAERDFGTLRPG